MRKGVLFSTYPLALLEALVGKFENLRFSNC